MPQRPPRHQPQRVDGAAHHEAPRASSHARGYTKRWQKLSRMHRRRYPLCADPFGVHGDRIEPGAHVDHIVPLARGGTNDSANLQTLCASCHSRKTVLHDGGFGRPCQGVGRVIPWYRHAGYHATTDTQKGTGFAIGG